jgi:hypothetical protein
VVKEALKLVSQCLKLELVLFQALKHYCLDIFLRTQPGSLGFHFYLVVNSSVSELVEIY